MPEKFDLIKQELLRFRCERNWVRYHDPKNLAEAISIESSELLENFLWKTTSGSRNLHATELEDVRQEVADIFIYLIYLCEELNIDELEEVTKKLEVNTNRFPLKADTAPSK